MRLMFQALGMSIGLLTLSASVGLLAAVAMAETDLKGQIAMAGSILETPCAIAMESVDQSIDLGIVPLSVLKQTGQGPRHPFTVQVIDCRLQSSTGETFQTFAMTFDGPADQYGFSVYGQASGVSLVLDDNDGERVRPGIPLSAGNLTLGDRTLKYGLRAISNHEAYAPGDFQSTLRFKLDYY